VGTRVSLLPQDGEQRRQKTVKRRRRIVRVKDLMELLVEWSSAKQDGDDAQQVVHVHERVLYLMHLMRAFDIFLLVCEELRLSRKVGGQFPAAWKIFAKLEDLPGRAAIKVRACAKERNHLVVDECGDHRCKILVELLMSRTLAHK
jgi:hypothetical protein